MIELPINVIINPFYQAILYHNIVNNNNNNMILLLSPSCSLCIFKFTFIRTLIEDNRETAAICFITDQLLICRMWCKWVHNFWISRTLARFMLNLETNNTLCLNYDLKMKWKWRNLCHSFRSWQACELINTNYGKRRFELNQ